MNRETTERKKDEEKKDDMEPDFPLPSPVEAMKDHPMTNAAPVRIEEFMQPLLEDPVLGSLAQPSDLQNYLQAGFSALLNATLPGKLSGTPGADPLGIQEL